MERSQASLEKEALDDMEDGDNPSTSMKNIDDRSKSRKRNSTVNLFFTIVGYRGDGKGS